MTLGRKELTNSTEGLSKFQPECMRCPGVTGNPTKTKCIIGFAFTYPPSDSEHCV